MTPQQCSFCLKPVSQTSTHHFICSTVFKNWMLVYTSIVLSSTQLPQPFCSLLSLKLFTKPGKFQSPWSATISTSQLALILWIINAYLHYCWCRHWKLCFDLLFQHFYRINPTSQPGELLVWSPHSLIIPVPQSALLLSLYNALLGSVNGLSYQLYTDGTQL